MTAPVHRHADAVHQRRQDDDHLGVLVRHPVVANRRRLDAVLRELAEQLERDVDDDLDVHPGVVVDLHAGDGVDVRDVPPGFELGVVVGAVEDATELAVAALGKADAHAGDRLGRREARLADRLGRDGAFDALLDLGVERRHGVGARRSGSIGISGIVAHREPKPRQPGSSSRAISRRACVSALPRRPRLTASLSQALAPDGWGSGITTASSTR